jgi:hypothetical protein
VIDNQSSKQDTGASSTAASSAAASSAGPSSAEASNVERDLHDAAIHAPSHPVVVANPEHRARTEAIPAARVGELPGPCGTAEIHESTHVVPFRDGDPEPEGWYSGQGGITSIPRAQRGA